MRRYLIIFPLIVLLAVALGFAVYAWNAIEGPAIPGGGYLAMGLGIGFSLLIGCGLMALLFYSSRHGYDEPAQYDTQDEQTRP
jgi:hypothetical protein